MYAQLNGGFAAYQIAPGEEGDGLVAAVWWIYFQVTNARQLNFK